MENWSSPENFGPAMDQFSMEFWSGGTIFFRENWSGGDHFFHGKLVWGGTIFFKENWSGGTILFREYWSGDHFFQKKLSGRLILSWKIRFYQSFDILDFYTFNCRLTPLLFDPGLTIRCLTPD